MREATFQELREVNVSSQLVRASFALETEGTDATLLHVLPGGDTISPNDGRAAFRIKSLDSIVRASSPMLLLDWDHNSERADRPTEAAGWITGLHARGGNGGLWGRVEYTPKGKADVANKAYRFLSPVLELAEDRSVVSVVSIALTNRPALSSLSPIGDVSAYRERVRIACSAHAASTSDLPQAVRERLHRNGMTDQQIAAVEAWQQTDAYRGPGKKKQPAPTEAETRAACLRRGMSAETYDATRKFIDEQRARRRGE